MKSLSDTCKSRPTDIFYLCAQWVYDLEGIDTMETVSQKKRQERLSIRVTANRKDLIQRAAEKTHQNLSDFVLENAVSAAEAVIADDANFAISGRPWKEFISGSTLLRGAFPRSESS